MTKPSVLFVCVKNGGKSLVITLGREARVDIPRGTRLENWDTDEPSERGIEGIERMRLVRDDIAHRVEELNEQLTEKEK